MTPTPQQPTDSPSAAGQPATVTERALTIAAEHHAQHVQRLVAQGELAPPASPTGHDDYARLVAATYQYLHDTGAYAHLSASHPRPVTVHPDQVAAWLASPASSDDTVAEVCGVDDTFTRYGDDIHDRVQDLVTRACEDGVIDTAGHRVQLWQAADEGFLLTVDPPHGPRLSSQHLSLRSLLPDGQSGVAAAVAVLTETAHQASSVLDELAQQLQAARASATHPAVAEPTAAAGRAFRIPAAPPVPTNLNPPPAPPHPDAVSRHR